MKLLRAEHAPLISTDHHTLVPNKTPAEYLEVFYAIFGDFPAWRLGRDDSFDEADVVRRTAGITGRAELIEVSADKDVIRAFQALRGKRRPIRTATVLYPKTHIDQTYAKIVFPRRHAGRDAIIRTEAPKQKG